MSAYVSALRKGVTQITCELKGLDTAYSYSDRYIEWYYNGVYKGTSYLDAYVDHGGSFTATGLDPETTYEVEADVRRGGTLITVQYGTATTVAGWAWWIPKVQSDLQISPAEWLAFYNMIDEARSLAGLGAYGFTRTSSYFQSGQPFYYWMMTQPATAIDDINGNVANELKAVNSGDPILTWYFENLRVALNNAL